MSNQIHTMFPCCCNDANFEENTSTKNCFDVIWWRQRNTRPRQLQRVRKASVLINDHAKYLFPVITSHT